MKLRGTLFAGAVAAAFLMAAPTHQAVADSHEAKAEIGVLTCERVPGGLNLIVHSTANIKCEFKGPAGFTEKYKGETGVGLGIDLQWKKQEKLVFTVLGSASADASNHALAGRYGGAGGSAAAGVGVGAQVLVGGSNNAFALSPVAVSGSTGIGATGGVTYLNLEADSM